MARKNILLITTDQQRWDTIGAYNSKIKTPHLDRLCSSGITFDRAYTVNPVCTPSRCSILTGQYPSRHGCYTIGTSLPDDYQPTLPHLLSRDGYYTALCGKAHFQACLDPESIESEPKVMDREYFRNWHGPYFGFKRAELVIGHSAQRIVPGMHYGVWLEKQGVDPNKYFGNNEYSDFGVWNIPEKYHPTTWTADATIAEIDCAADEDTPFFIWSSFQDPHNPCMVPEPWASLYRPDDMPVYEYREGEFKDKPAFYQGKYDACTAHHYNNTVDFGEKDWHCIAADPSMTKEDRQKLTAAYYGMISFIDDAVGRLIGHLEQKGMIENTVIIFTTDHGDYLGNHGFWWKGLPAYEDIHRLPFIVRSPGCVTPGAHSQSFQSLVDVSRTLLSCAGVDAPPLMQGVDQKGAWTDAKITARDHALLEFRPTEHAFMQKVFWYDRYKMVTYTDTSMGELYDIESDPDQYANRWNDPAIASVKQELLLRFISAEMDKDGVLRTRTAAA